MQVYISPIIGQSTNYDLRPFGGYLTTPVDPADKLAILEGALELLADPQRWTSGWPARDAAGHQVDINDPAATRWCIIGAIRKVTAAHNLPIRVGTELAIDLDYTAQEYTKYGSISAVNDKLGYAAIMNLAAAYAQLLRRTLYEADFSSSVVSPS